MDPLIRAFGQQRFVDFRRPSDGARTTGKQDALVLAKNYRFAPVPIRVKVERGGEIMRDKPLHKLKADIVDYQRFSLIFLFLSAYLFLGSALPFEDKTQVQTMETFLGSLLLLGISAFFYRKMRQALEVYEKKQ